jgi:hypothetical protein
MESALIGHREDVCNLMAPFIPGFGTEGRADAHDLIFSSNDLHYVMRSMWFSRTWLYEYLCDVISLSMTDIKLMRLYYCLPACDDMNFGTIYCLLRYVVGRHMHSLYLDYL